MLLSVLATQQCSVEGVVRRRRWREEMISRPSLVNKHLRMFLSGNSMLVAGGDLFFF